MAHTTFVNTALQRPKMPSGDPRRRSGPALANWADLPAVRGLVRQQGVHGPGRRLQAPPRWPLPGAAHALSGSSAQGFSCSFVLFVRIHASLFWQQADHARRQPCHEHTFRNKASMCSMTAAHKLIPFPVHIVLADAASCFALFSPQRRRTAESGCLPRTAGHCRLHEHPWGYTAAHNMSTSIFG